MTKMRYNILRMALGAFLAVTIITAIKDTSALSGGHWAALGLGIIALIANYLPEPKNTKSEDRL